MEENLSCKECGIYWSIDYNDYPGLQDDDIISCSCGAILCKKGELI